MAQKFSKAAVERAIQYQKKVNNSVGDLSSMARNLTLLALERKLNEVYHRDDTITTVQKILLRKSKPNVLLTGMAGCGKTAVAEGLAIAIARKCCEWCEQVEAVEKEYKKTLKEWRKIDGNYDEDFHTTPYPPKPADPPKPPLCECVVYDLPLNACISGTKYRGEFEEKLEKIMRACANNGNIILFIDEIHQMNKLGDGAEGGATMGQVLKPALARAEIRVIGATTTEESKFLKADKALARRFTEVELKPLRDEAATMTAKGIMETYLKLHGVSAPNVSSAFLLDKINAFLPNTVFPDNFINVVDETLASAVFDGLTEVEDSHFNATLSRLAGVVIV